MAGMMVVSLRNCRDDHGHFQDGKPTNHARLI